MSPITFILVFMFGLIIGSIVLEAVVPSRIKNVLGVGICWSMMAITMSFLVLSTVGLAAVIWLNVVAPMFT
jgi:hypothetical protein